MKDLQCFKCDNDTVIKFHCDGTGYFDCEACGETYNMAEARDFVEEMKTQAAKWSKVLAWAETFPAE